MLPFSASAASSNCRRQDPPAHADARRIGLGKRPGMDHRIAFGVERPQAGHVVAIIAEFPIGRVFDQVDFPPHGPTLGQLDQGRAAGGRHIHAAGIVVIGDRVNRLDPRQLAGPVQPSQAPPRWPRGSGHPRRSPRQWPAPPDCPESPYRRSTSAPRDHDVAGVQQDIAHQVQQLIAAGRDDDLLKGKIQLAGGAPSARSIRSSTASRKGGWPIVVPYCSAAAAAGDRTKGPPGPCGWARQAGFPDRRNRRPARSARDGPGSWPSIG